MKIQEIVEALENFAPLPLQESYDNAGLQIGITGSECSGALLCLDVTEAVVLEAIERGCNLIIAHHPTLFRGLKRIAESTQVERVVRLAIRHDITIYAAHTNLDNAPEGVNFEIAERLGLTQVRFLEALPHGKGGSGLIGELPEAVPALDFLHRVKRDFSVGDLAYAPAEKTQLRRIALCGGAGDFLIATAAQQGADLFLTGEVGYHRFFGYEKQLWIAAMGHYESEQFTIQRLEKILRAHCPDLRCCCTALNTNPICHL